MVDPYQAKKFIIDNGINSSVCNNDQLFTINSTQNMNESNRLIHEQQQQQQQQLNKQKLETNTNECNHNRNSNEYGTDHDDNNIDSVITNCSETINCNNVNECFSGIMCGPSSQHGMNTNETSTKSTSAATTPTSLDICQNQQNGDGDLNETLLINNLDVYQHQRDIDSETENTNQVCVIVNKIVQKTESNDSTGNTNRLLSTSSTTATAIEHSDSAQHSIEAQSNWKTSSLQPQEQQIATITMDSRKVEPLRININREPIKTKIKLGASNSNSERANQSMISPKSSSSAISDDGMESEPSHTQNYPKITIKPIVKPPSFESDYQTHHHHSHHHHSHHLHPNNSLTNSHIIASVSSMPQEGIPKLIISGNHQNYQKHIVSTESNIVPKLTASHSGSTSNLSIGSNDDDDSYAEEMDGQSASMELVPKLTIKLDNHQPHQSNVNDLTRKEVSLVSNDGVKVTLKPIAEPPLPKFTIKTNAFNDTAKLVMVNNATTNNEQTDESSDEQPSQPASCQPSPNDKVHAISSTSLNVSYVGQTAEDNLSTCSSGSSSSYSSSSSTTTPNNDIKLIIKATSTGSCVVSPNSLSIARNSPSSTSVKNSVCTTPKMNSKSMNSEQSKLNNLASSIVSSSTPSTATIMTSANSSNDNNAIPKLNIKLSGSGEYPQVIQNNDMETTNKLEQTNRTGSPLPKFTIRKTGTSDENIIIPKVTIKPVVKPNENADEAPLVTPKIILKPIPKPIDKPLEINTGAPGSPFRCSADMESQQSPRIILKINKNTMSQANETNALTSTTIITTDEPHSHDTSSQMHQQNDLKRAANYDNDFQAKKSKLDAEIVLSSDSDFDETDRPTDPTTIQNQINNHNDTTATAMAAQQTNVIRCTSETIAAAAPSSFDSNSGLRSILSRPQMKIQPQPLQTFLKALPPFKSVTTIDNKINDVIDLCHDSNDQLINEQLNDESTLSANVNQTNQIDATETNATVTESSRSIQLKPNSGFNWQYFYNDGKAQSEPAHPLVRQNIERTNVLAALMEAERNKEKSTNGNTNNNNSTAKETLDRRLNAATKGNHSLLLENDGSSSDCIVVEDTASEPFPTMDYGSSENTSDQNGRKKESMDRDSGVEVSNSVKSTSEDGTTPVAKRPRGRPRKSTATPKPATKKQKSAAELSKRKFAGVLMSEHNQMVQVQEDIKQEPSIILGTEQITSSTSSTISTSESPIPPNSSEVITSSTTPIMSHDENVIQCEEENIISTVAPAIGQENTLEGPSISSSPTLPNNTEPVMDVSMSLLASNQLEIPDALTPSSSHVNDGESPSASGTLAMPTTPTTALTPGLSKERKRRIVVDDDDESPTFNPLSRCSGKKARGKNRRGKTSLLKQKQRQMLFATPDKANESAIFTSPESIDRRKLQAKDAGTPALQVFEEDTRMSADSLMTSPTVRTTEFLQNEESQSSLQSSASATVENSAKKFRSKIEVVDPEGRTEFTVDMIAEYDWPPPKGCCPSRNRDTFMIQEQIAEYLGVKSFKRKYPDLPRRMVEMEERNYLMEKGLVSEKMCDLGLTAVLASDVLDIMHSDFYEKFDEYRRYLREKQMREISARQKQMQAGMLNKSMSARDSAMRAASMWNTDFNRSRIESRRECFDLQNLVVQIPERPRKKNRPVPKPSHYPVALVPGQFQEYYRTYSAAELLCYPLNTVLADPQDLDRKLREYYQEVRKSRCISDDDTSDSDSDSGSSSDSDSDSDSSDSSDESSESSEDDKPLSQIKPIIDDKPKEKPIPKVAKADRNKCYICKGIERCNSHQRPELFISCARCDRNVHPSCLKMSSRMVRRINEYAWHCTDCQTCIKCRTSDNEDKMMHCDQCDRSYHIYCIGLRKVPIGKWHCAVCTVCTMCGARRPEGHNNPNLTPQQKQKLLAVAKWTHEYEENPLTKEQEHVAILCTSCLAVKNSASKSQLYFS